MMRKIMVVVGTRPEAIKLAPVIQALHQRTDVQCIVLATAQHRQILDQVFELFQIKADIDLDVMSPNQTLISLTARLIEKIGAVLAELKPDIMVVQGDTTTVMTAALAAFYQKIPIAHVEAGLRTGDMHNPFPEEMNRVLTSRLARWHFAPTQQAATHLRQEGIAETAIYVTGNTVIDALLQVAASTEPMDNHKQTILVTTHRRENFGQPLLNICQAILRLAERFGRDYDFVVPVHPNPNVREVIYAQLGQHDAIRLIEPLEYRQFVTAMQQATLILTDSGGVQEEAPALGKPVLVLREETERPEAIEAGVVKLVGTTIDTIVNEATRLLTDQAYYQSVAIGVSPYGDGLAAQRIIDVLIKGG